MRLYFFLLIFVISSFPAIAQYKPEAMILPINFKNFNDTSIQESLNDFVHTELSRNFELKSKDEVAEAMEEAADSNASENCNEEACIKIMGKNLDVDYTFSIKIIDTGQGWDLTAIRSNLFEEATIPRNELCEDCTLSKARKLISAMLSEMSTGEVSLKGGRARLLVNSTPKSSVFIDGRLRGKTPLNLSVDADKPFDILMVAEGYNNSVENLILKPGEEKTYNKRLARKKGNIRITSEPSGATIYIDGKLELDAQKKTMKTPAELYKEFGKYELKLKYERFEDSIQTLRINKAKLGTKKIILKPKPGRLVIIVPSEYKSAEVYVDGNAIGDMDGSIVKTFELSPNVSHTIQVKDGNSKSETETVRIDPDGSEKVEFENFTDSTPKREPFKSPDLNWIQDELSWTGGDWAFLFLWQNGAALFGGKEPVSLDYDTMLGFGLQWKRLRFEQYTGDSSDKLYYSDGEKTRQVVSSSVSVSRIIYAPKIPDINIGSEHRWIWGFGYEFVNISLDTQKDGNRTIKASQPIIDFGYQLYFKNLPRIYYADRGKGDLIIQIKFTLNFMGDNFGFREDVNFGIGRKW